MSYLSYSKDFQGVGDIFMQDPARYLPFIQLLDNVMSAESELTQSQKEMIAAYTSKLNNCSYCVNSHSCILLKLETDEQIIQSLMSEPTEMMDKKLLTLLTFARLLTLEPGSVNKADIHEIKSAGWSEQTIEDTIAIVSTFAFLNRLVDGFGIKGSENHFQQVGNMVSQQGYKPLIIMLQKRLENSAEIA